MLLFYEADTKRVPVTDIAAAQVVPIDALTRLLVEGVAGDRDHLDEVIAAHAKGWTLERMPAIDLTVLRIASFELFHRPDVPVAVVLNEAVELAKRFSTDDSGRFVNGVLAAVAKQARGSQPTTISSTRGATPRSGRDRRPPGQGGTPGPAGSGG
ncbi:MAG: nusB [Ilumatobacteraceae bacterium]|jgi:N utilization substance protein B|nr:nusB [Ilumatobacteraceae bacterium]